MIITREKNSAMSGLPTLTLSLPGLEGVLKEGYLFKQSHSVWKLWKARYFILRRSGLYYYKEKSDTSGLPLGILSYRDISVQIDEVGDKKKKFCLRIHAEGKSYTLCCFSEEERNSWLIAILTSITNYILASREGELEEFEEGMLIRPRSLSRSRSMEAINEHSLSAIVPHMQKMTMFGSTGDVERLGVVKRQTKTPPTKRKEKAFSVWDFKWRDSYINFELS